MPTLYLIDAPNIVYRAFHAIRELKNSRGMPTNAVFGFANMLIKLMREQKPDAIAAIWDAPSKTFRDDMYADYKANRAATPDELGPQIPKVKQMLGGFGIRCLELPGAEADDIIATLSQRAKAQGWDTVIVSGDKDLMQLVGDHVSQLDTMKEKLYDRDGVVEKWQVPPDKLGDVLALMGDAVDNIPGVPGVGEKTAVKLISEFGSLNNLLASTRSLKGKLREKIETHADQARLSRRLVELKVDCDVPVPIEELRTREPDRSMLGRFFQEMEFKRLSEDFEAPERKAPVEAIETKTVLTIEQLRAVTAAARSGEHWVVEVVAPDIDVLWDEPVGVVLAGLDHAVFHFIPITTADVSLDAAEVAGALRELLGRADVRFSSSDSKRLFLFLMRHGGDGLPWVDDLGVMSYVLNPSVTHDLDACVLRFLDMRLPLWSDLGGKGRGAHPLSARSADEVAATACRRTQAALRCISEVEAILRREKMWDLYERIERPLVPVLARIEAAGMRVDPRRLESLSVELGARMDKVQREIFAEAGGEFNIQSPKQLNEIMFEKLGYATKGIKKTKTGQLSTDSDVLERLAAEYALPRLILSYRTLAKLKGTYVDALPPLIREDGRIHTRFNQLVAATGRLSSSDPNLQNIPVRDEEGRKIREAFVPAEGNVLMSFDYSQIELRILAHVADDPILQESFKKNEDVHRRTAAEVFLVEPDAVDQEMRRKAKAVNFGIAYGQTSYGLSTSLGIGGVEAQAIIDRYFERYQGVKRYVETMPAAAREQGFVSTLFGRRRLLPDLHSSNFQVRQFAERNAINTPIQGTAADIIKVAMIRIDEAFRERGLASRMILQVHDELLFDVVPAEKSALTELVKDLMEQVLELEVPLVVDIGEGASWAAAH